MDTILNSKIYELYDLNFHKVCAKFYKLKMSIHTTQADTEWFPTKLNNYFSVNINCTNGHIWVAEASYTHEYNWEIGYQEYGSITIIRYLNKTLACHRNIQEYDELGPIYNYTTYYNENCSTNIISSYDSIMSIQNWQTVDDNQCVSDYLNRD